MSESLNGLVTKSENERKKDKIIQRSYIRIYRGS
jgi:hypothetical protein